MSQKVVITKEQAEAIKNGISVYGYEKLIKHHAQQNDNWNDFYQALNGMPLLKLVDALRIGYEVEPEFKAGDVVVFEYQGKDIFGKVNQDMSVSWSDNAESSEETFEDLIKSNILRHATPSEIAEEKECRFWRKLGREVNEYRKGDIILADGDVHEVYEQWNNNVIDDMDTEHRIEDIELICPLESRLDVSE